MRGTRDGWPGFCWYIKARPVRGTLPNQSSYYTEMKALSCLVPLVYFVVAVSALTAAQPAQEALGKSHMEYMHLCF